VTVPLAVDVLSRLVPAIGQTPPGGGKVNTVVQWVFWGCSIACVIALAIAGASLAMSYRRGEEGGPHFARLLAVCIGAVIIGSATGIIGALAG
jgi:hypothetical protein